MQVLHPSTLNLDSVVNGPTHWIIQNGEQHGKPFTLYTHHHHYIQQTSQLYL